MVETFKIKSFGSLYQAIKNHKLRWRPMAISFIAALCLSMIAFAFILWLGATNRIGDHDAFCIAAIEGQAAPASATMQRIADIILEAFADQLCQHPEAQPDYALLLQGYSITLLYFLLFVSVVSFALKKHQNNVFLRRFANALRISFIFAFIVATLQTYIDVSGNAHSYFCLLPDKVDSSYMPTLAKDAINALIHMSAENICTDYGLDHWTILAVYTGYILYFGTALVILAFLIAGLMILGNKLRRERFKHD